jgi:hypothetical protein
LKLKNLEQKIQKNIQFLKNSQLREIQSLVCLYIGQFPVNVCCFKNPRQPSVKYTVKVMKSAISLSGLSKLKLRGAIPG